MEYIKDGPNGSRRLLDNKQFSFHIPPLSPSQSMNDAAVSPGMNDSNHTLSPLDMPSKKGPILAKSL